MFCMSLFISDAVSSPLLLGRHHHHVVGTCSVILYLCNIFTIGFSKLTNQREAEEMDKAMHTAQEEEVK